MEQIFLVEGEKSVQEVLGSDFEIVEVYVSEKFATAHATLLKDIPFSQVSESDLTAISTYKTNRSALALVKMKENRPLDIQTGIYLALDTLNDPGNLGTIIRIADWYGIQGILASEDTAELYNPKVIAASKGSFVRMPVYYTQLDKALEQLTMPIYAAQMEGDSVYSIEFPKTLMLVMGNESHGISEAIESLVQHALTIPSVGGAESLNVAIATAVICDNIRRHG